MKHGDRMTPISSGAHKRAKPHHTTGLSILVVVILVAVVLVLVWQFRGRVSLHSGSQVLTNRPAR